MSVIKENIEIIREKIVTAAQRAGRNPDEVRLMAVSKTRTWEEILAVYDEGIRLFGENRVQEIKEKFTRKPEDLELHLIGHLQRNKAKAAAEYCSCIHSLDKWETLETLDKVCGESGKTMRVLLEVNISGEESKDGIREKVQFFKILQRLSELKNLTLQGLMGMAPFSGDTTAVRKAFRGLRELRDESLERFSGLELPVLSMGMSGDFEIAIEEGSTLVRVGTLLFGQRRT